MTIELAPLPPEHFGAWRASALDRIARQSRPSNATAHEYERRRVAEIIDRRLGTESPVGRDRLERVVQDGRTVGVLWLSQEDDVYGVRDVHLRPDVDATVLRSRLIQAGEHVGARDLEIGIGADDANAAGVVAHGFSLASTRMAYDFSEAPQGDSSVFLRDMTDLEYLTYRSASDEQYVAERIRNGESAERAWAVLREQHATVLPQGRATPQHAFLHAIVDGVAVGTLWMHLLPPRAFVYYIEVSSTMRGKGLGRAIMNAGAALAYRQGADGVALNVFGDNTVARALYESLGYRPISLSYLRHLGEPVSSPDAPATTRSPVP